MKKTMIPLILIILLLACSKPPLPECYNPQKSQLTISLGIENSTTLELSGYMITAEGLVYSFQEDKNNNKYHNKKLKYINPKEYCYALDTLQKLILKHQALYIPSDSSLFIELKETSTNTYFRAVWNPKFITNVNKEFHELYQFLTKSITK